MTDSNQNKSDRQTADQTETNGDKLLSPQSEMQSKLENLEFLLQDRENFIDNLVGRLGDQESYILGKEHLTQNLSDELAQQSLLSKSHEQALVEREKSIEQLEIKFLKTLDILTNKQQAEKVVTDLMGRFEELRENLNKGDQVAIELASVAHENTTLRKQHLSELTAIETENQSLRNRITTLTNELLVRDKKVEGLTNELLDRNHKIETLTVESVDLSRRIEDLLVRANQQENQIEFQHQWGRGALDRIDQLEEQVSQFRKSLSWRVTTPLRKSPGALKWFSARLPKLLLAPYRLITTIGWRYMPRQFHRIYHLQLVQVILNHPVKRKNATANKVGHDGIISIPNSDSARRAPNESTSNLTKRNKWQTGVRIDGPSG